MSLATLVLAFVAGLVSILSPCVLPLAPIIVGAAVARHRLGPAALAAGLAVSFIAVGLFIATIGLSIGLDDVVFRTIAALLMAAFGIALMLPSVEAWGVLAAGPVANWTARFAPVSASGISGQFAIGLLLGAAWSPCVGPTLGATSVLAAQGRDLGQVTLIMLVFAIGTVLPLLILGLLSRQALASWRGRLLSAGRTGKVVLGGVLLIAAVSMLSGLDKTLEASLLRASPAWLTAFTTRF